MKEKKAFSLPGGVMLLATLAAIALTVLVLINAAKAQAGPTVAVCIFAFVVEAALLKGLLVVNPNEGQVVQLFGRYVGTLREQGFRWLNPFTSRMKISLRVRNFETAKLKVNDLDGNPIEIAAVVVWQVVDSAEAVFEVDNFENFVQVQSESALCVRFAHGGRNELAEPHGGDGRAIEEGDRRPAGKGWCGRDRSAHQPPGICRGDRRSNAATPAGCRDCCRPSYNRRRRGQHRGNGAGSAIAEKSGGSGSGTPGVHGEQSSGRSVRRAESTARRERGNALFGLAGDNGQSQTISIAA